MINRLLIALAKTLLWLRYRIRIRGVDQVAGRGKVGILFLPNHPALIDPIILMAHLYGPLRPRALGDRDQIDRFLIRRLARRFGVLPIPDVARAGSASGEKVRQVMDKCVGILRSGGNVLLYPAGHAYRQCTEQIRGTSAVESILGELPEVRVVLIRTQGLWGSGFSWASGREPSVGRVLSRGAKSLLASGVLFAPRRQVDIELVEPDDLPRQAGRTELNRYLEDFYNQAAQPNTYVPCSIWERGGPRQLPEPARPALAGDLGQVPEATRRIVRDYLEELTGLSDFDETAELARDLGMDSLLGADLVIWLQKEFGFGQADPTSLRTVGDVMLAAFGEAVSAGSRTIDPPPTKWFRCRLHPGCPANLLEMTITEAFLAQARRAPGSPIVADQASGVRTYRDLVTAILAIRPKIRQVPGEHIGVMMPASVAANVVYLATLFAEKTPVMANWTGGVRNLRHGLDSVGVQRVLTARALVSEIQDQGIDLADLDERFVFLEDLAASVSVRGKLAAWLGARLSWRKLSRAKPPETAVILFTSGSESLPKAVPLTHRNILTNVRDIFECVTFGGGDCILGILPPFHSFGLTSSVVLPLCGSVRSVYYPNPTDGGALGRMIEAYDATILIGTPTFLNGIVQQSVGEQLRTLRLVVSGAEKCPPRVYEAVSRCCPQTIVLEGYGVTECSPVISVNRPEDPRQGTIGKVLDSLDWAIVDPASPRRVEPGQAGMLLVRGPSVFDGYLNYEGPSPFVTFEGNSWYRTGDLVSEGAGGVLSFAGRLKRFIKLGGEMISLPAIETVLEPHIVTGNVEDGPVLAVVATPSEDRPEIVLFTVTDVSRESVNIWIRQAGLSGLHNIRRVVRVDELPLLGTGKVDYRKLESRLAP